MGAQIRIIFRSEKKQKQNTKYHCAVCAVVVAFDIPIFVVFLLIFSSVSFVVRGKIFHGNFATVGISAAYVQYNSDIRKRRITVWRKWSRSLFNVAAHSNKNRQHTLWIYKIYTFIQICIVCTYILRTNLLLLHAACMLIVKIALVFGAHI